MTTSAAQPAIPEFSTRHPVTLINAFTVPVEESERFLERWRDNARAMTSQPGFIRAHMYRSLIDTAELRFVNVADWPSGDAHARAVAQPEWRTSVQRVLQDPNLHISNRASLYEIAIKLSPHDGS